MVKTKTEIIGICITSGQNICRQLWYGRGFRFGDGLSVWHELEFFSEFAGSITGPLLTYEVLTAFFLEAGFLGVMLFGWDRVGPGLHFCHLHGGAGDLDVHLLDLGLQ